MARSSLKPEKQHPRPSSCPCSGNREVGGEGVEDKEEVKPPVVIRVEGEVAAGDVEGVPLFHSVSLLDACHVRRISETSYCIRLSQKSPDPRYSSNMGHTKSSNGFFLRFALIPRHPKLLQRGQCNSEQLKATRAMHATNTTKGI